MSHDETPRASAEFPVRKTGGGKIRETPRPHTSPQYCRLALLIEVPGARVVGRATGSGGSHPGERICWGSPDVGVIVGSPAATSSRRCPVRPVTGRGGDRSGGVDATGCAGLEDRATGAVDGGSDGCRGVARRSL